MPLSMLARCSLWRWAMPVMAIAPPTMMATIGIKSRPKPRTESTNLTRRLLRPQGLKPLYYLEPYRHGWSRALIRTFSRLDANSGGADRDRTGGLLVANQALSQLSYSPLTAVAS